MDKQKKFRVLPTQSEAPGVLVFELLAEPFAKTYVNIGKVQLEETPGGPATMNLDYEIIQASDVSIKEIEKSKEEFTNYLGECIFEFLEDRLETDPDSLQFKSDSNEN